MHYVDESSASIRHLMEVDEKLAALIASIGPITYSLHEDSFAFLVHEIVEQMLSVSTGNKLFSKLKSLCNGDINPYSINNLSEADISSVGISKSKSKYIKALATGIIEETIDLSQLPSLSDSDVQKQLMQIRGIGSWTSKMYMIFVLGRENVLPYEDAAFIQVYKWLYDTSDADKQSVINRCQKWSPYASIAARYFYIALDSGLTKKK